MKKNDIASITVIGLGYIGLPTAALLASRGLKVIGVDAKADIVATIQQGEVHIIEPDLDSIVRSVVQTGRLQAQQQVAAADVFLIAVPTPLTDEHTADMRFVESAVQQIATVLQAGNLIIIESTSPVGTTEHVAAMLAELRPDLQLPGISDTPNIAMTYCPERVLPGRILRELVDNDRVIGGITKNCAERAKQFYQQFVMGECLITTARTAEMVKLTENAYRDVNIAFANEISMLAEQWDINVWQLREFCNRHPRVNILQPGPGVGGHCIAVDPYFLIAAAPEASCLLQSARTVNEHKLEHVVNKIIQHIKQNDLKNIACLGLSFKADTDDLRESPAVKIVTKLAATVDCNIAVVEPNINILPNELRDLNQVNLVSLATALEQNFSLVALVAHQQFKAISKTELAKHSLLDTCGVWALKA